MKIRYALAVLVAVVMTPLALSLGMVLLVPVLLLLVPAALLAGIAVLPALFVSMTRVDPAPTGGRAPVALIASAN